MISFDAELAAMISASVVDPAVQSCRRLDACIGPPASMPTVPVVERRIVQSLSEAHLIVLASDALAENEIPR